MAGGLDYDYTQYNIIIPADVTSLQFTISINDDDLMEGNEYFSLLINTDALPLGVYRTDPYEALVTIIDDDSKLCQKNHLLNTLFKLIHSRDDCCNDSFYLIRKYELCLCVFVTAVCTCFNRSNISNLG